VDQASGSKLRNVNSDTSRKPRKKGGVLKKRKKQLGGEKRGYLELRRKRQREGKVSS